MGLISSPYVKDHLNLRKIKCPRNYVLKTGAAPFVMERIPELMFMKEADARRLGITLWRRKKDGFGRYIQNFANYDQPLIAASFAKETIYNASHPICQQCGRRCWVK
jgi:hypothetical protein